MSFRNATITRTPFNAVYELTRELTESAELGDVSLRISSENTWNDRTNDEEAILESHDRLLPTIKCFLRGSWTKARSLDLFQSKSIGVALTFAKILAKSPDRRFEYQRIPPLSSSLVPRDGSQCSWKHSEATLRETVQRLSADHSMTKPNKDRGNVARKLRTSG